jgi:hypothetical protein
LQQQLDALKHKMESETNPKKADRLERKLEAIEKQIAESKRQQQMIAIAQTAAQALLTRRSPATVTTPSRIDPHNASPTSTTQSSGGGSWFVILLLVGGVVLVIVWLRKSNAASTIYRL